MLTVRNTTHEAIPPRSKVKWRVSNPDLLQHQRGKICYADVGDQQPAPKEERPMSWKPKLNPLVCPFCEQACNFPRPVRLRDAPGFNNPSLAASCGCGAFVIVDIEIHDDEAQLHEWAERASRTVEVRIVAHVDFWSVAKNPEGEWDGDWVDALFYRLPS
ncbi:hypothetical protein A3D69_01775 [Candidatus Uhrbacteria bacterium RIFCSPHIGHO2_02_FULL_54_11]|nr:MAG: hypothetical protein A3D69_01775 [Candidatus Uhrbacteria bacterium RIFCSPHIGHO2_02_FULL_54_11]